MSTAPQDSPATKADLETLKGELLAGFKELRDYIEERTHDAETRLLRAFSDHQQAQTTRFRHMKADLGNLNTASDERLAAVEERLANIEKRLIENRL